MESQNNSSNSNKKHRNSKKSPLSKFRESSDAGTNSPTPEENEQSTKHHPENFWNTKFNNFSAADVAIVVLTAIMAYFTIQLFYKASEQATSAIKSANAAIQAIKNDSIRQIKQDISNHKKDILDSINNKRMFTYQDSYLNAQIEAIKQNQKEFDKINRPLLQIDSVDIAQFGIGKKLIIKSLLYNLGSYPVEIKNTNYEIIIRVTSPPLKKEFDTLKAFGKRTVYNYNPDVRINISKEHPMPLPFIKGNPISKNQFDDFNNRKCNIYIFFITKYNNIITNQIGFYKAFIIINNDFVHIENYTK